eukprot:4244935-Pleurochrysis_carterae.AAC.1
MGTGVFRRDFVRSVHSGDFAGDMKRVRSLMRVAGSRAVRKVDTYRRAGGDKAERVAEFLSNLKRDRSNINGLIREGNIHSADLAQLFKEYGLTDLTMKARQKIARDVIAAQRK